MVNVTHAALTEISDQLSTILKEGEKALIRLSMSIGWGGPSLRLTLEESALENDEITEKEGIQFLVNERDKVYFEQAKIDYKKNIFGNGEFVVLHV